MEINRLTGSIGAKISGVQLADIDDAIFSDIANKLWTHQVLVFRDQQMNIKDQIVFGKRFGALHTHPEFPGVDGHAEVLPIINRGKDKTVSEVWHSDVSCDDEPPSISILRAIEVPSYGGDTMWASQYAALEHLSSGLHEMIEPLHAVHKNFDMEAVHPVVRTHPETGRKALYVNHGFTTNFENMTPQESKPLIDYLVSVGSNPDVIMRHKWQSGDIVIWDNRCVMHFAVHDYGKARRELHRVTVRGERPQ
jgi:taurine dioxygenase